MEQGFIDIVTKMYQEQGAAALTDPAQFKKFFSDYVGAAYKQEAKLLRAVAEAGAGKFIAEAANLAAIKTDLVKRLDTEYFISPAAAAEAVDLLALVLRGDRSKTVVEAVAQAPMTQTPAAAVPKSEVTAPEGFVYIPAGTFMMGSPAAEAKREDNEVQHQVTVSSFYMGKCEVSQAEYEAVMGTNHSYFKGPNLPVEQVSWYDAVEYCNRRSQKEGLTPAYTIDKSQKDPNNTATDYADGLKWVVTWNKNADGYRLPTEAEWEYACRAGTTTPLSTGNYITTEEANYDGKHPYNRNVDRKGTFRHKTSAVGSLAANPWGLYDMHGNVWEWCWDWYSDYGAGAQTNPEGAVSGSDRVIRGGAYHHFGWIIRSAKRSRSNAEGRFPDHGFRLARSR
jgi:formylglycine-generating enzyme required for sulfatase activity